jgi:tyrosinase
MNGDAYSQGGNGIWAPHNCTMPVQGQYCTPVIEGQGGGCVETGPYAGIMANISATKPKLDAPDAPLPGPFLGYQPRCIRRDISADLSQRFATDSRLLHLLTSPIFQNDTIGPFDSFFEGGTFAYSGGSTDFDIGLHGAGHYLFAGDPGGDV